MHMSAATVTDKSFPHQQVIMPEFFIEVGAVFGYETNLQESLLKKSMVNWEFSSAQGAVGLPWKFEGADIKWAMLLWEIDFSLTIKAVKSWPYYHTISPSWIGSSQVTQWASWACPAMHAVALLPGSNATVFYCIFVDCWDTVYCPPLLLKFFQASLCVSKMAQCKNDFFQLNSSNKRAYFTFLHSLI